MQRSMSPAALQSPHTLYRSRMQPRVHAVESHMLAPHSYSPYHSAPTRHEQQHEQLITAIVIDCLCAWGEHRAAPEWPPELVMPGPIPALVDALLSTRTRTLTLPQLITAIKERTGGGACGKALDMLNLKAYVRCFPMLFVLHSGRTPAGRPLDAVELRASEALAPQLAHADAMTSRIERYALAVSIAANAWAGHVPQLTRRLSMGVPPAMAPGPAMSPPVPPPVPQPGHAVSPSCANVPRHSSAYERMHPISPLQPKDLFGAASANCFAAAPSPADSIDALWPPGGVGFGIFAHDSPQDEPVALLSQLNDLFSAAQPAAPAPAACSAMEGIESARRRFLRKFELDRLFQEAVDRAMLHNVDSPVQFVAQELLRHSYASVFPCG